MAKSAIIVAHGGVGSPKNWSDGPAKAVQTARQVLKQTGSPLEAAVAGAVVLEDDPRFNAGTGSVVRLDGKSIEMDAAVMDSEGHFGAVACIQEVKNPIKVARALIDSPHIFLCGDGATQFARFLGFQPYQVKTIRAQKRYQKNILLLKTKQLPPWAKNLGKTPFRKWVLNLTKKSETIGVVVTDGQGNFAAASSTGGISLSLPGRVGDTPLIGCGVYAGKAGAVAATGIGEEIAKRLLSFQVYQKIANGLNPQAACAWGIKLFPKEIPIGIIAVSSESYGLAANRAMATAVLSFKY